MLLLFYPFKNEKGMILAFPPLYQSKLQDQGVPDVVYKH